MPREHDGGRRTERRVIVRASDGEIAEPLLGGKGASLARLTAAGFAVPRWFVVTTDVFSAALLPLRREIDEALAACSLDDAASLARAAAAVGTMVRGVPFAREDESALDAAVAEFGKDAYLAVRSSAVGEDGATASFAGQMETFLYVRPHEVVERVRDSWASAFGERVLAYRLATGARRLAFGDVRAAVVVQEMIESVASGVLFTRNPHTGAAEHVVSAAFGLGEGVVADRVTADAYFVDRESGVIQRQVARKDARVVFDRERGSGTVVEPLPPALCDRPVVGDETLRELARLGERIEAQVGGGADIEWAVAGGRVFVLQARPITAMARIPAVSQVSDGEKLGADSGESLPRSSRREPETVFDNSNIVESFPGVTTPLTFSFARRLYAQVFRRTFEGIVVPGATQEELARIWPNLLGYIQGRIYYNLSTWYRMNALTPHFEKSRAAWERMLGLSEGLPLPALHDESWRAKVKRPFEMAAFYVTLAWRLARQKADVERALAHFRDVHREAAQVNFDGESMTALAERFREFERTALRYAHQTNINDFFVSRSYDALGKVIQRFGLDPDGEHLENDLLCGEKGMDSVEPVRSVLRLAAMVRSHAALRALFESTSSPEEVMAAIRTETSFAVFHAAVDAHLATYGDRGIEELKLEVPSVRDDPAFLVAMIRNYIGTDISVETMEARERSIRDAADAKVRSRIGRDPFKRAVFDFVLARARMSVRFRENLRLARSRVYGVVKRMARAFGRAYVEAGVLDRVDDVFFLTVDEMLDQASRVSVSHDLRALVALRRAEHARFVAGPPPPARVVVGGEGRRREDSPRRHGVTEEMGEDNRADAGAVAGEGAGADAERGERVWRGTGCSPGVAVGKARVVLDPRADLRVKGEVLVARMTDPGWVFLMISAAAIVVEKGSLLSHTAIIGRELGVPTVVGLERATSRISDGARVRVDGRAGTVELIEAEGQG